MLSLLELLISHYCCI